MTDTVTEIERALCHAEGSDQVSVGTTSPKITHNRKLYIIIYGLK